MSTPTLSHQGNRYPAAVPFIFITLVLDVLGFGLLIPVAPKLVQSLLHDGHGGTPAEAGTVVGPLMSTYYLMAFLFAPLLGVLSDRFGRRPIILIALFGSGLDYFAQALAPSIAWLFATRALNGLSGASFTVASAYIADVTPPEKRAGAFGLIGAAFGLGFIIGPAIGGVLGHYDVRYPFYAAGILTIINGLYGYFVLPESLPPERRAKFDLSRTNPIGAYAALARYPLVFALACSFFLMHLAMFILHATWALHGQVRYGWSELQVGLSLMLVGVGAAVVQGALARPLIPRLGEPRAILIGVLIGTVAYVGYGLADAGWITYTIIVFASLGGIGQPAAQSLITKSVHADEQGAVQGALFSLQSLAGIFGPSLGGGIFAFFASESAANVAQAAGHHGVGFLAPVLENVLPASWRIYMPGAAFFLSAALCAAGLVIAFFALRNRLGPPPPPPPPPPPAPDSNAAV